MATRHITWLVALVFSALAGCASTDPLPSWHDGHAKSSIRNYVERVTDEGSSDFVRPEERIATFDNDGTLWAEQPAYFQLLFALDRVRALAPDHPEWRTAEPFKSVLANDMKGVMASGEDGIKKIVGVTHADITATAFQDAVRDWVSNARHPDTGLRYTEMVYQPMLELLDYLRNKGFKTYIVSGGGIDFMRVFAEEVYGIPPEQVVGSTADAKFEMRYGVPTIIKTGDVVLLDDKAGKPIGIYRHIGRRPIFAGGNSDGDLEMLQYTTIDQSRTDATPRFAMLIHHTDAQREWAYDNPSHIGQLDKALDEARRRGWLVVDMKSDWRRIYPSSVE